MTQLLFYEPPDGLYRASRRPPGGSVRVCSYHSILAEITDRCAATQDALDSRWMIMGLLNGADDNRITRTMLYLGYSGRMRYVSGRY